MAGYELRVITTVGATVANPDRVELFEAVNDDTAIDHMKAYAETLRSTTSVHLVPAGATCSIASDSGSEGAL